ncbi:4-hydroxythreonine-4-phosphate dehydrogenase [Tistlia consotensis]|uniref:4-hydroxythreonine-4-phosphate dehydrogenase n=1 Tax=Tistlia consotensis USBA 355 TaxID=560819 RepID=A0A1Y6CQZ2_9PROT|nr:4-hydroxythreonine-4-phosphate dehydrogenase PdxA [Tistlia consotensis]SMF83368.1 4-hydroxythreonine-4-phosphate dehydrogenase [Tistlia consotensis USBA 355]SNS32755.1 4-hydroxythreonine-4-phosphate dehydrogenase [Tistlia consotensis]
MPAAPADARLPLALTMGEPAGIGGEIALAAWLRRDAERLPPCFLIDDPRRLAALAGRLGLAVPVETIAGPEQALAAWPRALPVLPLDAPVEALPGRPSAATAGAVLDSIRRAVALVREGRAGAVVTNPIQKSALYEAGFRHPGHTEFLAELAGEGAVPIMMLACPELRVVPVTVHLSLRRAIETLTSAAIVQAGRITAAALARDFAIARPRLAVAGLNPHAGEGGAMGAEDLETVAPAVAELRDRGVEAVGPLPADTLFHAAARRRYDAALCMYHDQALIPVKTLDFEGAVNVTLGLPFVRTSPDHGTALDIAGSGKADPASLIAALRLAGSMAEARARAGERPPAPRSGATAFA